MPGHRRTSTLLETKHLSDSRSHIHGTARDRKEKMRRGKYQQVPRELPESPGSTCEQSGRGTDRAQRKESRADQLHRQPRGRPGDAWGCPGTGAQAHRACALPWQPLTAAHRPSRPPPSEMLARVWPHPTQENKTFDSSRHKGTWPQDPTPALTAARPGPVSGRAAAGGQVTAQGAVTGGQGPRRGWGRLT